MYYRRKIMLCVLDAFGGSIDNTFMEKMLFLFCQKGRQVYEFVPYQYGPFSFASYRDKSALVKRGILRDVEKFQFESDYSDLNITIDKAAEKIIDSLQNDYSNISNTDLVKKIYLEYPYYAINSIIASEILSEEELREVILTREKNNKTEPVIFTIGYEKRTIDGFVNELIKNNIACVIDVRKNPFSMNFPFIGSNIARVVSKFDISYHHLPDLGIEQSQRKNLDTFDDYQRIFRDYKENLADKQDSLEQIRDIINSFKRIALLCYERDPKYCHRQVLANYIKKTTQRFQRIDL
ncbi:MAG: DUF488 domain-containing protein [Candidatus Cloacimonetes bacterium]|nr:DUF488 domain-containing protein [Candidatus Cloacimonadota bacterium]